MSTGQCDEKGRLIGHESTVHSELFVRESPEAIHVRKEMTKEAQTSHASLYFK
jgi:hypothetical protein